MKKKFATYLLITMAATAALGGTAFAERLTDAERAEWRALDSRPYVKIDYTEAQLDQGRTSMARAGGETPYEVAGGSYTEAAYSAADFAEGRAVAAEMSREVPFDLRGSGDREGSLANSNYRLAKSAQDKG